MSELCAEKFDDNNPNYKSAQGLVDGAKHQIDCYDCGSPLFIIWQVNPHFYLRDGRLHSYNYKVKCPFCGGSSLTKRIDGEIRGLGIVENIEQPDGGFIEKHITRHADVEYFQEDELCVITVSK